MRKNEANNWVQLAPHPWPQQALSLRVTVSAEPVSVAVLDTPLLGHHTVDTLTAGFYNMNSYSQS